MSVKLFLGEIYYPCGGYEDFRGNFENAEIAIKYIEDKFPYSNQWAHIVLDDKIIIEGRSSWYPETKWKWEKKD